MMKKKPITTTLVAALCSLLLLICQTKVTSGLVNIRRPRASTTSIRWINDKQTIKQHLQASEAAATDAVGVNDANSIEAAKIKQSPQPWKPPSQNTNGKIFKIQQPQDLLDFVIEDERLSIVKVYASWCKTCTVFDVRYRKLANQLSDLQSGPVRFAEMQYDTKANEEMCKLLNATKLPYVLIYRGSQGKVADFQCTPAKFQMLIDTVNRLLSDGNDNGGVSTTTNSTAVSNVTASSSSSSDSRKDDSSNNEVVNSLKEQLVAMENEAIETLELMKAQIEVDKGEIAKMVNVVKIQKSMIEERDQQIQKLSSVIESKDGELKMMTNDLNQKDKKNKQMEQELALSKSRVGELTNRTAEAEKTIASLELKASIVKKEAKEKEHQTKALWASWEKQKLIYEEERNSVRKMAALSVKNMKTKVRSLVSRKK